MLSFSAVGTITTTCPKAADKTSSCGRVSQHFLSLNISSNLYYTTQHLFAERSPLIKIKLLCVIQDSTLGKGSIHSMDCTLQQRTRFQKLTV